MNEGIKPQVKNGTSSGHVVMNDIKWPILVALKSNVSNNEVFELGDPHHTLSI
jgi:hypothetical protein